MSSITTQQAKLDLELIPKEKRLKIRKCNRRLNPRKIQREPTFQVILDALALTLCYSAFLITTDVPEVYMHQFWDFVYKHDTFYIFKMDKRKRFKLNLEIFRDIFKIFPRVQVLEDLPWRTFAALINKCLFGKTAGLDKIRLCRAQILWGMYHQKNVDYVELLWEDFIYQIDNKRNKIGMHASRDDYLINTLRFVSAKEETQIYGAILPESLTSHEMKETQAYKTYLVSTEEPIGKSKRVKRLAKKSIEAPARGVVIRETHEMPLTKQKEKVDVTRGKGIESSTVTKTAPNVAKIKPSITSEGTGVKPGVHDVVEEESSKSKAESWRNDEDYSNNENKSDSEHETDESDLDSESDHEENKEDKDDEEEVKDEFVETLSNDSDDEDEIMITDKDKVDTNKGFVQEEGTDTVMTNVQQGNENLEILQVIEDVHRSQKDKDEESSTGSNQRLKKRKTSKDAEPAKCPKAKESQSGSSKGMPQDQEENPSNDDEEPKEKNFDEFMSTPIEFSALIMNGLNINNLTQETLLGPAFRLLKGTHSNYAELEYDFKKCYKALSEKLDWENTKGGDYPFDLTNPIPLVMNGNLQMVLVDYFFNNDLKYMQRVNSTMTYATSLTKTKAVQYDLPGIEDMVTNI
nr:hypothetical protein [Tanacetum cinerariifolium]